MASFSTEIRINAPAGDVWATLADIGNIYQWNPGVKASHLTSSGVTGLGESRHCDLGGNNYLKEEVVTWDVGERLTMRVTDTNLPMKSVDIRFTLRAEGEDTIVIVSPVYEVKYGLLGQLLDAVYVRRTYFQGMKALLAGLKRHVEEG